MIDVSRGLTFLDELNQRTQFGCTNRATNLVLPAGADMLSTFEEVR